MDISYILPPPNPPRDEKEREMRLNRPRAFLVMQADGQTYRAEQANMKKNRGRNTSTDPTLWWVENEKRHFEFNLPQNLLNMYKSNLQSADIRVDLVFPLPILTSIISSYFDPPPPPFPVFIFPVSFIEIISRG